jgi:pathogenesis-related protein 1
MTRMASVLLLLLFTLAAQCAHAEFLDCIFADGGFEDPGTTNAQALAALSLHNCARKTVDPAASPPLGTLSWSPAIATVAQTFSNSCLYDAINVSPYGQNLQAIRSDDPANNFVDAVSAWLAEQPYYSISNNKSTEPAPPDGTGTCNDYTQVVWNTTTQVGCARTFCTQNSPIADSPHWYFIVCEYSQPGNDGNRPY